MKLTTNMNQNTTIKGILSLALLACFVFPSFAKADATTSNLISNSQLETIDPLDSTKPLDWYKGIQWGSNVPSYEFATSSIPLSDISSGNAISVSFDTYTGDPLVGGDAKWYFTPVPVTAGRLYNFNDSYVSNTPSYLTAEFFGADHSHLAFGGFVALPVTPDNVWKSASATFTAPAGAAYMTVFHTIQGVGKLITDSYSLTEVPLPTAFDKGFVSLTFDDGYLDHLTNALPELDKAGLKATFYIISHVSGFGIVNADLEKPAINTPHRPANWIPVGSTGSTFNYPVPGHNSGAAAQVDSTVAGTHAGWNFAPVTVLADEDFTFSEYYKSTTNTDVYVEITTLTGTIEYIDTTGAVVTTKTPFMVGVPTAASWTKLEGNFYLPPEAKSVSVTHTLEGIGSLTIDDVVLGAFTDFLTSDQVKLLQADGQEVGGHTQTHANLTAISTDEATSEIAGGRTDLINGGISPTLSFAYPYGNFNDSSKLIAKNAGYTSARTVFEGLNGKNSDKYALLSKSVNKDTTVAQVQAWIDDAIAQKRWLILVFHQIQTNLDTPTVLTYGTTPANLADILAYINKVQAQVLTVDQGVALMDGSTPVPVPTPTIDAAADIVVEAASSTGAIANYTLPASHNGTETLNTICNPTSGTMFAIGTTTVSCSATNTNNVSTTSSFKIIVKDTTAPVITVPADISMSVTEGSATQIFFYGISALDSVDGNITPSCNHNSGDTFSATSTVIACTASDTRGNSSSKSFKVLLNFTTATPDPTPNPSPTPSPLPNNSSNGGGHISAGRSSGGGKRMFNIFDFNSLVIHLGKKGANLPGDFNADGVVDILDFNIIVMNWSK